MSKFLLIPDSFKGTMSSSRACEIMKEVILSHNKAAEVIEIPVADGGEGSVDAFLEAVGGRKLYKEVTGPFIGERVQGYYGLLNENIAVIEMAAAAALPMVEGRKDPCNTTTYGVGELIMDAISKGASKVILALGGSATNDGAAGLAAACGAKFYNEKGEAFIPTGGTLSSIKSIDLSELKSNIKNTPIVTMCDINNPFYGEEGAAYVYAPQKGADSETVKLLDENLRAFASLLLKTTGVDVQKIEGSGAAGGMGGGMAAMFSSPLMMGIETVLDTVHFDTLLDGASYVFTGEGRIDGQSLRGKVVIGVARRAKAKGVPVIAFVGDIGDNAERAYSEGVSGIFSINRVAVPYEKARLRAEKDLSLTVDNLLRFEETILNKK